MPRKSSGNPTIADVARESGVGSMTVSRVINGGKLVNPRTAARVRAAIHKLGYEPNEAARILKGQSARTIGLIVPDLADPFFAICAHAIQQTAARHGYVTLLLATERNSESEAKELALMKSRSIAGVLIVPSNADCVRQLQEFRAREIPVVMLDRTFPGLDAGEVTVENREGAQKAVKHLIDHGHTNILCVGYDSQFNSIGQRIEGYRKAMGQAGLDPHLAVVEEGTEVGPVVLDKLRSSNPPTALFCLNNVSSIQVLQTLQRENIRVPEKIAIVGFDDFDLAPLLAVPLTAVRQPAAQLGHSAARILLDWIDRPDGRSSHVVLPTELVVRRSCGCRSTQQPV